MAGDDDISEIAPRLAVAVDGLRRVCDPSIFTFETTRDLEPLDGFMRQTRALEAISFGTAIERRGFNLFVLGTPGSGRHTAVGEFLTRIAAGRPSPDDWVYVNDFKAPQRPRAISLPTGLAPSLRDAMSEAVRELAEATPAAFESDEYRRRQRTIDEEFEAKQQKAFEALSEKARARGVAVLHTPLGFALAPVRDGAVVKPEVFNAWSAQERGAALAAIGDLQTDLREFLELIPRLDKERRGKVRALDREFATLVVDQALADARNAFGTLPAVVAHLDAVRADMVENAGLFASAGGEGENQQIRRHDAPAFRRYMVNVIVTNGHDGARAPIVREDSPTLPNLVGRVEHLQQMGTLVTDFMLIKPGALHRANGGYLLIDARKILSEPLAWDGLKRALRHGRIEIESVA
ncbi:MAG: AAA family ATPase, partial [Rhodospirillales bacterium]|nr:AAA family ATPase [Rhodospirillales bacterium]